MNNKSIAEIFIKEAIKTESKNFDEIAQRLIQPRTIRLLHASMGLITEGAELLDAMKKFIFYGKELDIVNIKEELGDSNYYEAIAHHELGSSFEEVMIMCIQKLRKRYHEKEYNAQHAVYRNLSEERNELEKKVDLAIGFGMSAKKLTENLKLEIIDPITHWLDDVDLLTVTCGNRKDDEKYTLDEKLLTCKDCRDILDARAKTV